MNLLPALAISIGTLLGCSAWAQTPAVQVEGAWARASVPGQKATGAFMRLMSPQGARLFRVESSAAAVAEVHEMKMEGDVMKMRAIAGLDLPAGKAVELRPGGYHVMLMDLKAPLNQGGSLPLTLVFKDLQGGETRQELTVPVHAKAPGNAEAAPMGHGHKH
ncbi:MAG: copper chaperone PCu(A)C [Burkholderiaceae bacterium]|nr:copper chaperone PCu(A)C [Burkholderiaceae bacterium]